MSIDPGLDLEGEAGEDGDQHEARLGWMIDEFREAQARRRAKAKDKSANAGDESIENAAVTAKVNPL